MRFLSILASLAIFLAIPAARAATNVDATYHWAWNDAIGWIDLYGTASVNVSSNKISGYASSSIGDISFDCATTRIGNICAQSNYSVTVSGGGNLSGWAWNDAIGWISFDCNNHAGCGTSNYRAYIDGVTGEFYNYAWSEAVGWISVNCADPALCATSAYRTITTWRATSTSASLDSSVFDTGVSLGAEFNSVLWHGSKPAGTRVEFQFATANASSGPWNYGGPDGTSGTFYSTEVDVPMKLDYAFLNNQRYFRYRVTLTSDQAQSASPRIDEIIVSWSP